MGVKALWSVIGGAGQPTDLVSYDLHYTLISYYDKIVTYTKYLLFYIQRLWNFRVIVTTDMKHNLDRNLAFLLLFTSIV